MVSLIRLALRVWGYKRTAWLMKLLSPTPADTIAIPRARRVSQQVRRRGTCLEYSLLLWWRLRWHGLPADLRIGVRMAQGFEAHAWVEHGGEVLNDRADVASYYTPISEEIAPERF